MITFIFAGISLRWPSARPSSGGWRQPARWSRRSCAPACGSATADASSTCAVLPDTTLQGVRLYEFDDRAVLLSISEAEKGVYDESTGWSLTNVAQTRFLP